MTDRLALELTDGRVRGIVLGNAEGGGHLRWHGVLDGGGAESLARRLEEELGDGLGGVDEVLVALPSSPASVYHPLRLPPLGAGEMDSVVQNELRRQVGEESVTGLVVKAWQFEGRGEGPNTLAVGVPGDVVDASVRFARSLGGPPVTRLTTPPLALHHGLRREGRIPDEGVTGLAYLGDRFGSVSYVRGDRWILVHHFPVAAASVGADPKSAEELVRDVRQSFMYLRSRSPGAELREMLLCGPGLPADDLALRAAEVLPDVHVGEFSFGGELDLEGVPHAGDFLSGQSAYAVPLLLAAYGQDLPLDFLPSSFRVPVVRRRLARRSGIAAAVGSAVVLAYAAAGWWTGETRESVGERLSGELAELRPRIEAVRRAERLQRELRAGRHLMEVGAQQHLLTPVALRELAAAAGEGVELDSVSLSLETDGYRLDAWGVAHAGTAAGARRALGAFQSALRASPVFLRVEVPEQHMEREGQGRFSVRFFARGTLLRAGSGGGAG